MPTTESSSQTQDQAAISSAKAELVDPRTISKQTDSVGRSQVAREVLAARSNIRTLGKEIQDKTTRAAEINDKLPAIVKEEVKTKYEIKDRNRALLVRLKKLIGIGDKTVNRLEEKKSSLSNESLGLTRELNEINKTLPTLEKQKSEIPDPRKTIEEYKEKALLVPLTNEQKRELLKPEVLAELTMPEYISLWRRLNPNFLTHVTRQGFRDHSAMEYHSSGMETFSTGLTSILEDSKNIRPAIELKGLRSRDDKSVHDWLSPNVLSAPNEDEALEKLDNLINSSLSSAPNYPDRTSVHFAVENVLDSFYGAERGNEVVFVFPTDMIASQRNFGFNHFDGRLDEAHYDSTCNDLFVWPSEPGDTGINLDAGIVLLPKSKMVDPETGSKYLSEARFVNGKVERVMIKDEVLCKKFVEWGESLDDKSDIIKLARRHRKSEVSYEEFNSGLVNELVKLGFSQDAITGILKDSGLISDLYFLDPGQKVTSEQLNKVLKKGHAEWKRADNGIKAEEYWNGYFSKNPDKKPKHIVYYDWDPTSAIYRFQRDNSIRTTPLHLNEGNLLGFDDHSITDMKEDQRANIGHRELMEQGKRIIHNHFHPAAEKVYP